jgi:hypothetical protein
MIAQRRARQTSWNAEADFSRRSSVAVETQPAARFRSPKGLVRSRI